MVLLDITTEQEGSCHSGERTKALKMSLLSRRTLRCDPQNDKANRTYVNEQYDNALTERVWFILVRITPPYQTFG